MFDSNNSELHLGILTNQLARLKGKMQSISHKLSLDSDKVEGGIDKPALEKEFDALDNEYKEIETRLIAYENKVLSLTEL